MNIQVLTVLFTVHAKDAYYTCSVLYNLFVIAVIGSVTIC